MKLVDINSCTAKQLALIPGIDKTLGEAIVKYRDTHQSVQCLNELWRVQGMSRTKLQLLRRHCSNLGPQRPNTSLPFARVTMSPSMIEFLNGADDEQLANPIQNTFVPGHAGAVMVRNMSNMEVSGSRLIGSALLPRRSQEPPREKSRPKTAPDKVAKEAVKTVVKGSSDKEPCLKLETSPSGNNINLSCKIDKRFFTTYKNATTIGKRGKSAKTKPEVDINITVKGKSSKPQKKAKDGDVETLPSDSTASSPTPRTPKQKKEHESHSPRWIVSSGEVTPLTEENLRKYERKNRVRQSEKQRLIEDWVARVNHERKTARLLSYRNRMAVKSVAGNSNEQEGNESNDTQAKTGEAAKEVKRNNNKNAVATLFKTNITNGNNSTKICYRLPNKQEIEAEKQRDKYSKGSIVTKTESALKRNYVNRQFIPNYRLYCKRNMNAKAC